MQVESYMELPKEKRPPDSIIWYGTGDDIEDWFDKVFQRKKTTPAEDTFTFVIDEDEIG